ncbi:MAG: hypothetical protein F4174_07900 [Acidobacteria bacterium]|nr:hypothetical protein [Acidobacteriota bacterium]
MDTEVPAALTGRLVEILVPEGETVTVNSVVGRIAAEGEAWSPDETSESDGEPASGVAAETDDAPTEAPPRAPDSASAKEEALPRPARRQPRRAPLVRRMAR